MSYEFKAAPKVVYSQAKYRPAGPNGNPLEEYGSSYSNLNKDVRVKALTPAEQEEEFVRIEKDRIKLENMQKQLLAFKKSKKKVSPYDIKPSANPKVNVNLTFFLTDSTDQKPPQQNIDIQTDVFKERPKSPQYIPKKTGRDVSTQIEDNELFNFDREVTPIIDVIVTKTLEQSIIEIEEEEEIHRIKQFKEGYYKRRQEDDHKWKVMLQKELEAIAAKDRKLEEYRLREEKRILVLRKLQAYQTAKNYMRDVSNNAVSHLYNNGLYQNQEREDLINKMPSFFVDGVIKTLTQRYKINDNVAASFDQIEGELVTRRQEADKKFKSRQEKRRIKRINNSKEERLVRFMYQDETTPSAHFVRFVSKLQEQDLTGYFDDYRVRVHALKDKLQQSEVSQEEFAQVYATDFPELQLPNNLRLALDGIKKLSFNLANNMYYAELPRDGNFNISASAFSKEGAFLYQIDKSNPQNNSKSIKYLGDIKIANAKISDDMGIKLNLAKIEADVGHIVLAVEVNSLEQSMAIFNDFLQHSRFRIAEFATDQTIDSTDIFPNFKLEELKDPSAEGELGGKIVCYYLYNHTEWGWMLESVKSYKNVLVENRSQFNNSVEFYLKTCLAEQLREFSEAAELTGSAQQSFTEEKASASLKNNKDKKGKEQLESPRKEEEPVPVAIRFVTKSFGPLNLKATETLEEIQAKVDEMLDKQAPQLKQSFEYGYEVHVQDQEMIRATQVKKIGAIPTFTLKRKPKPYEEPPAVLEGTEGDIEGEQDQDDAASDD